MRRLLADSDEQVFEFLNIVDIATRSNICFPVPSKRPDDVLSVLEMVWINWAGPMCHLISDTGGEFEGELVTASEAPWQESGCHKGNKRCRSTRFRGNAKTRLHCELGKECSNQLVWTLACPKGHLSRTQVALVAFGREAERRTGIAGVARSLARVRTTNVMFVGYPRGGNHCVCDGECAHSPVARTISQVAHCTVVPSVVTPNFGSSGMLMKKVCVCF